MTSRANHRPRFNVRLNLRMALTVLWSAIVATLVILVWPENRLPKSDHIIDPFEPLERAGYDLLFAFRGPEPQALDPRIAVVGFTYDSARNIGQPWPVSRSVHAELIRKLKADGARLIVMDFLFSTPSTPKEDLDLQKAIKEAGNVVLPFRFDPNTEMLGGLSKGIEAPYHSPDEKIDLESAAAATGFVEVPTPLDGRVRGTHAAMSFQDEWLPSLGAAAYLTLTGVKDPPRLEKDAVVVGDRRVPRAKPEGRDLIGQAPVPIAMVDFAGGLESVPVYPYEGVIGRGSRLKKGTFRNAIVFVGLTGYELTKREGDRFETSYSRFRPSGAAASTSFVPGVVVQAQLFNSILRDRFVRELSPRLTWLAVFCYGLVGFYGARRFANWRGPAVLALLTLAYFANTYFVFLAYRIHIPYVLPMLFVFGTASLMVWNERGAIRRKWAGYVSPELFEYIQRDEDLKPKRVEASVVFGDIRGFTTFSDMHEPDTVVRLLNKHYDKLTRIAFAANGTIDKFMGDGLLAVFGSPIPQPDDAIRAVRSAWYMHLASLEPIKNGAEECVLATSFGVTTGPVVVGHVGSDRRHDLTHIGDVVNTAARLYGATPDPALVIDSATYLCVHRHVRVQAMGPMMLKGKIASVEAFRVLEWSDTPYPEELPDTPIDTLWQKPQLASALTEQPVQ